MGRSKSSVINRFLNHLPKEFVNLILTITKVSTLDVMIRLLSPSTSRCVQLEGPKEVGSVFEVFTNSEDLMDQILHADDVFLAKGLLYYRVGGKRGSTVVHFGESTLIDQFSNALLVWVSPCNMRLTDSEHVQCGLSI